MSNVRESINIVATGSTGNLNMVCNKIMIDMGVKRSIFKEHLDNTELILVSHRHGDHINIANLRTIKRQRPALLNRVYLNRCTWELVRDKDADIAKAITHIIDGDTVINLNLSDGEYHVRTFPLEHDVENQGFVITTPRGNSIIHATDTATMAFAPDEEYDYILVEGNWDEDTLIPCLMSTDYVTAFRASRNLRHLSVQALCAFVKTHSHSDTLVYQLHESHEYGVNAKDISAKSLAKHLIQ